MKGNLLLRSSFYNSVFFEIGDIPFNGLLLMQIILLVFMLYGGFKLSRFIRSTQLEKRIRPYSLASNIDDSWYSEITNKYIKFLNSLAFRYRDSVFLNKWADKYIPYVNALGMKIKNPLVLVMNQFVISITCLFIAWVVETFNSNPISSELIVISLLIGFIIPWIFYHILYMLYKSRFRDNLLSLIKKILPYLDNQSFSKSLSNLLPLYNEQIQLEFNQVIKEIDLGLSAHEAFDRLYKRTRVFEIRILSDRVREVLAVGGDLYDAFSIAYSDILEIRRHKKDYIKKTYNLRVLMLIILAFPVFLFGLFYLLDSTYFLTLYNTSMGRLILLIILVLYISYILMILEILRRGE